MAGSNYERILAAEWLAVMATETLDSFAGSAGGAAFALPDPSKYFATMVVFLMLAAVAMFGEKPGKLAAAFGGVAALAIVLTPNKGGKSPVVGAVTYFSELTARGPNTTLAGQVGPNPNTVQSGIRAPLTPAQKAGTAPLTPAQKIGQAQGNQNIGI
jgi:hypothetical protein